ncbi:hypothetical protein VNO78_03985 [Psophocarpus tetragonolobus]|uniref:Uncharacterized protein n=1 Tax=Psophocarpus tetragonolobus TaxID=3891 RepID=A0AAN9T1F4_PSOTE
MLHCEKCSSICNGKSLPKHKLATTRRLHACLEIKYSSQNEMVNRYGESHGESCQHCNIDASIFSGQFGLGYGFGVRDHMDAFEFAQTGWAIGIPTTKEAEW